MSLDPEVLYEACPLCDTAGTVPVQGAAPIPCPVCSGEGLVEHGCPALAD